MGGAKLTVCAGNNGGVVMCAARDIAALPPKAVLTFSSSVSAITPTMLLPLCWWFPQFTGVAEHRSGVAA
jgi:hypothetical protein